MSYSFLSNNISWEKHAIQRNFHWHIDGMPWLCLSNNHPHWKKFSLNKIWRHWRGCSISMLKQKKMQHRNNYVAIKQNKTGRPRETEVHTYREFCCCSSPSSAWIRIYPDVLFSGGTSQLYIVILRHHFSGPNHDWKQLFDDEGKSIRFPNSCYSLQKSRWELHCNFNATLLLAIFHHL
jgi:hypothetical protein